MKLLGIDVGSTTVKVAVIDEKNNLIYSSYVRHFSKVKETVLSELNTVKEKFGGAFAVSVTGSAGLGLSRTGSTGCVYCHTQNLSRYGRCRRAWRRGRENHFRNGRNRAAYERQLCGRYGRVHRPNGNTFKRVCREDGRTLQRLFFKPSSTRPFRAWRRVEE